MYGIYLKCEKCEKSIGGEDVTPKQQGLPTLRRGEGRKLRALAAELGWTHRSPDDDFCPECSKPLNASLTGAPRKTDRSEPDYQASGRNVS